MKTLADKSVLLIDDDTRMLRALERVLADEGADVTATGWAGDAVEVLVDRRQTFDLVITDLRMPFVTGLTVVYAVHTLYPALPVIVLTAFGRAEVKAECLRQGAVALLEKPLNTAELLAAVQRALSARRRQGEASAAAGARSNRLAIEITEPEMSRPGARPASRLRKDGGATVAVGVRKEPVHEY